MSDRIERVEYSTQEFTRQRLHLTYYLPMWCSGTICEEEGCVIWDVYCLPTTH